MKHLLRDETCATEIQQASKNWPNNKTCGLYYKRIMIVIDAPSVVSKWRSKLERHLLKIVIDDTS
jgi:hypothetical protein